MITVCTKDMKQILSRVVPVERGVEAPPPTFCGITEIKTNVVSDNNVCLHCRDSENPVGDDVPVVPRIELLPYGQIADKYINQLNDFYKNVNVIKYVIMPNHIHLLLQIPDGTTRTSSPTGFQTDARPVEHSVIADFVSTFKRFCHREIGEKIFQRSFHDHVIRDENDFLGAVNYMENNPIVWIDKSEIHPTKPRFCGDPEKR